MMEEPPTKFEWSIVFKWFLFLPALTWCGVLWLWGTFPLLMILCGWGGVIPLSIAASEWNWQWWWAALWGLFWLFTLPVWVMWFGRNIDVYYPWLGRKASRLCDWLSYDAADRRAQRIAALEKELFKERQGSYYGSGDPIWDEAIRTRFREEQRSGW